MLGAVNSKVHRLTELRAGRYGVRIATATRDSYLVQNVETVSGALQLCYSESTGALSLQVKRKNLKLATDPNTEVSNRWSNNFFSLYAFVAWTAKTLGS
jgi:hypothetical protein